MRISDWSSDVCSSDRLEDRAEQILERLRVKRVAVELRTPRRVQLLGGLGGCGISVGLAGVGRRAYIFFSGGAGKRLGRSSGGLPLGSSITRPGPLLVERLQRDLPGRPALFDIIGVTVEPLAVADQFPADAVLGIGGASCRERVCQDGKISGGAGA